ncbi:MAG: ParM/StbA family protein [Burkholderiales bacterium]|nr:ParM/StbA family protein [Burkholderiales bacterium]
MQYLGLDDGHFSVKCVGVEQQFTFPSKVVNGFYPFMSVIEDTNMSSLYTVEDNSNKYTVMSQDAISSTMRFLDTRTDDFPHSDINLVLINHALLLSEVDSEVTICSGLPFQQYYINNAKNTKLIQKKKSNIERLVKIENSDKLPKIKEHKVVAEGVAGYFDLKFNSDGSLNDEIENIKQDGLICIVDIGGRTTDIVTMYNDAVDFNRSATLDIGGLYLQDTITEKVKAKFGYNALPNKTIDALTKDGVYKNIDAQDIVNNAKKEMANEIANAIKSKIGQNSDIGLIAFIGGGSLLLKEQLNKLYDNNLARFVKDPIFSNARGMCKMAKYL